MSKRKPLTQNEDAFLKGSSKSKTQPVSPAPESTELSKPATPTQPPQPSTPEKKLMDSILSPNEKQPKEPLIRFTLDLNEALHDRLDRAARNAKKSKAALSREILEAFLPD